MTEPIPAMVAPSGAGNDVLPSLRYPDLLVYYRQAGAARLIGGYDRNARPVPAGLTASGERPAAVHAELAPATGGPLHAARHRRAGVVTHVQDP